MMRETVVGGWFDSEIVAEASAFYEAAGGITQPWWHRHDNGDLHLVMPVAMYDLATGTYTSPQLVVRG